MLLIPYGDSSYTFRGELPEHWGAFTAVTITITSDSGTAILAATAGTLYAGTTLNGAVASGAMSLIVAADAAAIASGDRLRIAAGAAGPQEHVVCNYYDAANKTVYLEDELKYAHADGAAVTGMFATKSAVDLSDLNKGDEIIITWTPDTDDTPVNEMAVISVNQVFTSQLWAKMREAYPSEFEMVKNRNLDLLREVIVSDFESEFKPQDINRALDSASISAGILKRARLTILAGTGDAGTAEYDRARREWLDWVKAIKGNAALWIDANQDKSKGETEVGPIGWRIKEYSL